MKRELMIQTDKYIQEKIYNIRNLQVMLDRDIAILYEVETRVLNQAVKRNLERFPKEFCFQLTDNELYDWKSQFVTSNKDKMGLRKPPYAFTEQGVAMLSAVLKSDTAVKMSIQIIQTFVAMRKFVNQNATIFIRLDKIEHKQIETDLKLETVFKAIEEKEVKPKNGIFFDGQVFDAHVFVSKLIKSAQKSIVLIDNYIDESVLMLLTKRSKNVEAVVYTKNVDAKLKLDIDKHNKQYPEIKIKEFNRSHDRFLIIDNDTIYHIGASLKDLGKKWFAFSKFEAGALDILKRLL
ncbi:MAG: ORF6N domain-containing protein [Proteobacteria bacterium]|nr:ORF6N domain-containing protein [Pseudomonadota bacterium]